jgi:hypothetical protein
MSEERPDIDAARRFLAEQARRARRSGSSRAAWLPGLPEVAAQHREGGWMQLVFHGWDVTAAARTADLLLDPDAVLFFTFARVSVFEGFAPEDDPGAGVAARVPAPPPPQLSASRTVEESQGRGLGEAPER